MEKPRNWKRTGALLLLLIAWIQTALAAESVTVTGVGADREEALRDAMRLAVEQAVGTAVVAQTLVQNAAVVRDEIYTKAQGFVQSYTILQEARERGQYRVTAAIAVDNAPGSPLMRNLERVLLARDPRIAVVLLDADAGQVDTAGESAVIEALAAYGFTRLFDAELVANRYGAQYLVNLVSSAHGLSDMTKGLGVDFLIVGKSRSESAGDVLQGFGDDRQRSGMDSYRARIDARLVRADTGEIVAARAETAAAVDIVAASGNGKALAAAGKALGDYMAEQLGTQATQALRNVQIVASLRSYGQVDALQQALRQIAGVSGVYVREYRGGTATVDVDYGNTAQALVRALESAAALPFAVETVSPGLIRLRAI